MAWYFYTYTMFPKCVLYVSNYVDYKDTVIIPVVWDW